jgi:glycosyltransferase involved in cell wall biosynthesis
MRILLVGDYADDPRLGSSKVVHKLREELRAAGHVCDALFAHDLGAVPANRQVRQLVSPLLAGRAIARACRQHPYDVVDVSSAEGLWFGIQKALGRYVRTALIVRSNGLEHVNYQRMIDDSRAGLTSKPWSRRVWYPASRLSQVTAAARLADRMIVLTDDDRRFVVSRGWLPPGRVDVVPHGVSDRFLATPSGTAAGRGAGVLFCGAWDYVKGISYLVAAAARLVDRGTPVRLTVLGPGLDRQSVVESFPERVRPFVTVVERVPEADVIDQYRRHDLLVFPSTYEGFGLVVIEAMSQGLPIVATPVGCAPALIRDRETGRLVPPRDASALADAIADLMERPDARRRMGDLAARAVSSMTWRETARRTLATYEAALTGGSRKAA